MNGATAPPIEEPLSKRAVANARSRFGNHSETAFVAAGQLADCSLTDGIRDPESDRDVRVIRIRPAILEFEIRGEQREGLPVNVVDNRRGKQKTANPPAQRRYRANFARSVWPGSRHAGS